MHLYQQELVQECGTLWNSSVHSSSSTKDVSVELCQSIGVLQSVHPEEVFCRGKGPQSGQYKTCFSSLLAVYEIHNKWVRMEIFNTSLHQAVVAPCFKTALRPIPPVKWTFLTASLKGKKA